MIRLPLPAAVVAAWLLAGSFVTAAPPKDDVPWKVQPDPLPWKVEKPKDPGRTFLIPGNATVEYPTAPSPFCVVRTPGAKTEPTELKYVDLRTMEQVGKPVKENIDLRFLRISPWGDHFMSIDATAEKPTLTLWTTTDQKIASTIVINDEKTKIEAHEFAGKDQVLTVKEIRENNKPRRYWQVWDVKTGKELVKIHSQQEFSTKWIGFSPGRRYLVMQHTSGAGYELEFWDLTNGERAGRIEMQDKKDPWGQCGNLPFTYDGKELALVWRLEKEGIIAKIMRFDMEKGTKKGQLAMREEMRPSAGPLLNGGMKTFQFLPDGRGWLLGGHQIVERETGAVVWAIDSKTAGDRRNLRFVENYLVSVEAKGKDKALTLTPLPPEFEAAMKKAQAAPR
jgi:hypothetical protein